jgi:protein AroM
VTKKTIGAVTVGQTPRDDVVSPIQDALGDRFEILQIGALDGVGEEDIRAQFEKGSGALLVTRLRNGNEVRVKESFATPRLRECVNSLQETADIILFLCTGDFSKMKSARPVVYPGPLLRSVVRSLSVESVGVITPAVEQRGRQHERWKGLAHRLVLEHASPYGAPEDLEAAAERIGQAGVDVVAMDCIGYTRQMKRIVGAKVGRPVVTASSLLARVASELLES